MNRGVGYETHERLRTNDGRDVEDYWKWTTRPGWGIVDASSIRKKTLKSEMNH